MLQKVFFLILLWNEVFIGLHWHKAKFPIKGMQPKPILIQFHRQSLIPQYRIFDALFQEAIDRHRMVGEHLVAVNIGEVVFLISQIRPQLSRSDTDRGLQ